MNQSNNDIKLGRFLSLVLRHSPSAAFLRLDENGYADVELLLLGCRRAGHSIDRETLERIVSENDKQRYCFNTDHTKIRANQGHSVSVNLELKAAIPPARLYHGTATRFLGSIRREGITRQSRQHVHLSADRETAATVGSRHGVPAILPIDTAAMVQDGYQFWLSENGVWLCLAVPWRYIIENETK